MSMLPRLAPVFSRMGTGLAGLPIFPCARTPAPAAGELAPLLLPQAAASGHHDDGGQRRECFPHDCSSLPCRMIWSRRSIGSSPWT